MKKIILQSVLIVLLIAAGIGLYFLSEQLATIPEYTNMTDQQAYDQVSRWINESVEACRTAGGTWWAGFAQVGCTVAYAPPDHSWFIKPISNPRHGWDTWGIPICWTGIIVIGLVIMMLAFEMIISAFYALDERRRKAKTVLSS